MSPIIESRIAVLESQNKEINKDIVQVYRDIQKHMEREESDREVIMSQMNDLRQQVADVNKEITHYKGLVGGIILAITCIGTAIGFAVKYLT